MIIINNIRSIVCTQEMKWLVIVDVMGSPTIRLQFCLVSMIMLSLQLILLEKKINIGAEETLQRREEKCKRMLAATPDA